MTRINKMGIGTGIAFAFCMLLVSCSSDGVPLSNLTVVPEPQPSPAPSAAPTYSFTANWTAPTVNMDGSPIDDTELLAYNLYYGTESGLYPNKVSVGSVLTAQVGGLPAGTYYVVVTAYVVGSDPVAESPFSGEVSVAKGTTISPEMKVTLPHQSE